MFETLFGSKTAAQVLFFLQNYEEGYGQQIADTYEVSIRQVQNQLKKLEDGGWFVSRLIGKTRVYTWNPRNPYVSDLRSLLQSGLDTMPREKIERYYRQRRRPRRPDKPL